MEESKLVFSMDHRNDGPTVVFSKDKPQAQDNWSNLSLGLDLDPRQGHCSRSRFLARSPSSPGSLADLSVSSTDPLVTTNLVKSSSTDLEPRHSSSRRGKPLLSLAKSLSTDISRRVDPAVNLSKSDSKLHLKPWKQPRIPEARPEAGENDGWASPSFRGSTSPTEPRASSLIAELEDTRRRFSEAMQDPLSMLNKIMGEESCSSPKQHRFSGAGDSPASQASLDSEGDREDADLKYRRRADGEQRGGGGSPLRRLQMASSIKNAHSPQIKIHGDEIQVVELQHGSRQAHRTYTQTRGSSLPLRWLFLVGFFSFVILVLPVPTYMTGLSVGVVCGFMLGLVVVFMFAPRRMRSSSRANKPRSLHPPDTKVTDAEIPEGWMTEAHSYNPDTFHPSASHPVYVTLEGSRLCLSYPRASDETPTEDVLCHSCTYQLVNCKVSLAPPGLARKRVWNKKYPICIILTGGDVGEDSTMERLEEDGTTERNTIIDHKLPVTLYLFGRTGREKEEWFQHFLSASRTGSRGSVINEEVRPDTLCGGYAVEGSTEELHELPGAVRARTLLDYKTYMTQLIGAKSHSPTCGPGDGDKGSPPTPKKIHNEEHDSGEQTKSSPGSAAQGCSAGSQPTWVNSLVGRIFWDFLQDQYWTDQVAQKIQKKLSKIKLPYFMNELTLADLDMGTCLPQVLSTSKPTLDHRGLWLELELMYTGGFQMTLATKMNLCKLGKEEEAHGITENQPEGSKPRMCLLADSDEESSSAGSSGEEEIPPSELLGPLGDKSPATDVHTSGSTSRKILRFVDKITKSKYFQKATENEYIRKKIAEVSSMPLLLSIEVLELSGTLAINIPPPPTDRIWYSFQATPRLDLHVRPMLGDKEVTLTHVTEWIEKKLQGEFQKVFVMPNMDDVYLPLMTSGLDDAPTSHNSLVLSASQQSSMESQDCFSE